MIYMLVDSVIEENIPWWLFLAWGLFPWDPCWTHRTLAETGQLKQWDMYELKLNTSNNETYTSSNWTAQTMRRVQAENEQLKQWDVYKLKLESSNKRHVQATLILNSTVHPTLEVLWLWNLALTAIIKSDHNIHKSDHRFCSMEMWDRYWICFDTYCKTTDWAEIMFLEIQIACMCAGCAGG
jgi:hypothetical protein